MIMIIILRPYKIVNDRIGNNICMIYVSRVFVLLRKIVKVKKKRWKEIYPLDYIAV